MKPEPSKIETSKPLIIYERQPDRLELIVRGVCGALLGILLTFWLWRIWNHWSVTGAWLFALAVVICCAIAAIKCGDGFWRKISEFMRWS